MEYQGVAIAEVVPESIAEEIGLEAGDYLYKINDQIVYDFLDYQYLCSEENLELYIRKRDGEEWLVDIEKEAEEDLGLEFMEPVFDGIKRCRNKCIFCFVDQMPEGLRESLYCKDDDYRLSFLHGSYITLTNLKEEDLVKIKNYRLTPLYVSVHAMDPKVRVRMMNNQSAERVKDYLQRLADDGIKFNTQIVLCPGINDGQVLDNSIEEIAKLFPAVLSLAVVPVGLTKHRQGLYPLEPYTREQALAIVEQVEEWQKILKKKLGTRLVYLADEFYLLAGLELPKAEIYEEFRQIENGVGLSRIFLDEFAQAEKKLPKALKQKKSVTLISGVSAAKFLVRIAERLNKIKNLQVNLVVIKNSFLGHTVTVTGLLSGNDILEQLKHKNLGDCLILPEVLFKEGAELFLDGLSLAEFKRALPVKVIIAENNAYSLVQHILEVE